MKRTFGNKIVNIPDSEINKFMVTLDLTEEEAIELWASDNGYEINEEQMELDAKAAKARVNKNVVSDKKERKTKASRKEDSEKREIINFISSHMFLDTCFEGVNVANPEREITFTVGGNEYSITLTRHRAKK